MYLHEIRIDYPDAFAYAYITETDYQKLIKTSNRSDAYRAPINIDTRNLIKTNITTAFGTYPAYVTEKSYQNIYGGFSGDSIKDSATPATLKDFCVWLIAFIVTYLGSALISWIVTLSTGITGAAIYNQYLSTILIVGIICLVVGIFAFSSPKRTLENVIFRTGYSPQIAAYSLYDAQIETNGLISIFAGAAFWVISLGIFFSFNSSAVLHASILAASFLFLFIGIAGAVTFCKQKKYKSFLASCGIFV